MIGEQGNNYLKRIKKKYFRSSIDYHKCSAIQKCNYVFVFWFRPLSTEAIFYARSDTHYLLYVYDMIKKDLMAMSTNQCNYIELVFQRSADVCKTVTIY
jgi:exosome complex exonuclease RRP6